MGLKAGNVVQTKTATITQGDSASGKFTLPANSMIVDVRLYVPAAITSSAITIGITGSTTNGLCTTIDSSAAGMKRLTTEIAATYMVTRFGSPVTIYVTESGSSGTTGVFYLTVDYI
jgi:hypothetical protein